MNYKTAIFLATLETPDDDLKSAARAAETSGTHLACLILAHTPPLPIGAYGAMPYGAMAIQDDWPRASRELNQRLAARADEVEIILANENVRGTVEPLSAAVSDMSDAVAQRAALCDVVFAAPDLRSDSVLFRNALYGVLFESPVGVVLNGAVLMRPERVFVAWDTGLAATRAVHAALPILKDAKEVMIGCFDPIMSPFAAGENPGSDLAKYLTHHSGSVSVSQFPSGGAELASVIQARAGEFGANLVVMGAFGHSRLRQAVFGGTTRAMLEQTNLPVLMAH